MKKLTSALIVCAIIFLMPLCMISILKGEKTQEDEKNTQPPAESEERQGIVIFTEPDVLSDNQPIKVLIGEEVVELTLHEYVVNVVEV